MNDGVFVNNDPVNFVDPWGLTSWDNIPWDDPNLWENGFDDGELSEHECREDCEEQAEKERQACRDIGKFGCTAGGLGNKSPLSLPISLSCNAATDSVCDHRYRNAIENCKNAYYPQ